ncbi:MAG TPA: S8 family peptidase, partial [Longimicrobiaceae bacterium]
REQAAPGSRPENWWLLDPSADGFPGISAERAYREILAGKQPKRPTVLAIIDTGVDLEHEDLRANAWTNPRETAGNGRDDDGNGFVDDVHGWNFIGGPSGDVNEDTFEVTRIYADLRARCGSGGGGGAAPRSTGVPCARLPEIRRAYDSVAAQNRQQLQQVEQINTMVDGATEILRRAAGGDSLTAERVAAIPAMRADVAQAKLLYGQLLAAGISPRQVDDELEALRVRVNYGLNLEFDPRSVVGDDPAKPTERGYGNPRVRGPDADHGTHVAGIAGAVRGNGIGVDGVASPVRIMALRVVPNGDERDKDVANAIRYAADNGAHVINMSFGKSHSPQKRLVDDAVRYADSKGVLMVHAAGNDGSDLAVSGNFPNRYYEGGGEARNWIEVGASSYRADSLAASFSNYGRTQVDVFAPGVDIRSTYPDNRYEDNQGTSMSSPVVAGLAALILAYYPELSAGDVRQVILESATRYTSQSTVRPGSEDQAVPFGGLSATGAVVNAYEALRLAEQRAGARR